jgi:hypothetical protein
MKYKNRTKKKRKQRKYSRKNILKGGNNYNITLINYANKGYEVAKQKLRNTALTIGNINNIIEYTYKDIDKVFLDDNKEIFAESRGAGLWLWKPYFILKTLNTLKDGEFLMYCDTAIKFVSSIDNYINNMKGSILLFQHSDNWVEKEWTKADIFVHFNCKDNKEITNTKQLDASHSIWKKDDKSIEFVSEWLNLCKNKHFIDDSPSIEPNFEGFHENRHDQSILSVLAKLNKEKYNIQIEFSATEFGNNERDKKFPQLLNHHRERK